MTAVVFLACIIAAWVKFTVDPDPIGHWYAFGSVTIYVALFATTLATACFFAIRSREGRLLAAMLVLVANFGLSHWGWTTADKITSQAVLDLITAAYFIGLGRTRWEIGIGSLYLMSVLSAGAAWLDWIPGPNERPYTFLAWSYPDITSWCGNLASIVLGLGAGDWGIRVRNRAWRMPQMILARIEMFSALRVRR